MSERFPDEVLQRAAEDLWEQIGVGCLCQQAEVPHWCEDCQVTLGIIRAAMRAVLEGVEPPMQIVWLHGTDEEIGRQLREMSGYPVKGAIARAASDGSPR